MILKTIGYFLARWDMAKLLATATAENLELKEKNYNLWTLAAEEHDNTEFYRQKLNKMHRRAQRAEAAIERKAVEVYNERSKVHEMVQENAMNLEIKLGRAERFLTVIYPFLHLAWLHTVGSKPESNNKVANDIVEIEAKLRAAYRGIEIPPQPEKWSTGNETIQ